MNAMNCRIYIVAIIFCAASNLLSQSLSSRTSEMVVNKDRNANVAFPIIQWRSPVDDDFSTGYDTIRIVIGVKSVSELKYVTINSGQMVPLRMYSSKVTSDGQRIFSTQLKLIGGVNMLQITAENIQGAKVISQRKINRIISRPASLLANPPVLIIRQNSIVFTDSNGNGKLDGREEATVRLLVDNEGTGDARRLKWSYTQTGDSANIRLNADSISVIKAGSSQPVTLTFRATELIATGNATTMLTLSEPNGFDSNPVKVSFETSAFVPPNIGIVDGVFSSLYTGRLKRNTPTTLRLLVQNNGGGFAEKVKINIVLPENVLNLGESFVELGTMAPGTGKTFDVEFIANARYQKSDVPILLVATEKHNQFGSERTFTAGLDQALASVQMDVKSIATDAVAGATLLRSLVDVNVPETSVKRPNRYALIIGNEDYVQFQTGLTREQNVAFARNDAIVFRDYAVKTLGCPENQVYLLTDATKGQMNREIQRIKELVKLQPGSELIFYYAGHGLPDFATQKGYLIPVDVSAANVTDGIGLADLYSTLASSQASRVTVFLDACFSGGGRGENGLLAARTVKIRPTGDLIDGNIIVYTAASGEEVSLPLKKESHGLFTYYVLQKLKDTAGVVTMQELKAYLENEIPKSSLIENGMKQTPQVLVSPKLEDNWAQWKF
jgi:hypothetical protein